MTAGLAVAAVVVVAITHEDPPPAAAPSTTPTLTPTPATTPAALPAKPTYKRIGACDGYNWPGHAPVSAVVTGVQFTYKIYDADSKHLVDGFSVPGIRTCPTSVSTIDDVPQSIGAEPDYTAVIKHLLPRLR